MTHDVTYRKKPDGKKRRKHLSEIEVTGALAERMTASGRRRIKLTQSERDQFNRREMIERAVALFLDTETGHTWDEIASALGISVMALKDLTKTQDFIDIYDQHFAELGHDPRLRGAQAALADMLPEAVKQLRSLLSGADTPASVKMKAIEKVFELNGISPVRGGQMDRHELMEFLKGANITITQNNIDATVPNPYERDVSAYVEGRWEDIDAHQAGTVAGSVMDGRYNEEEEFPAMESEP